MLLIPLSPLPAQIVNVPLANQVCQIEVAEKFFGTFLDLYVNNTLIIGGVICQNLNPIVRQRYLGFNGDLMFVDTQGNDDPEYSGLGSRFQLLYLTADEVASILASVEP